MSLRNEGIALRPFLELITLKEFLRKTLGLLSLPLERERKSLPGIATSLTRRNCSGVVSTSN